MTNEYVIELDDYTKHMRDNNDKLERSIKR